MDGYLKVGPVKEFAPNSRRVIRCFARHVVVFADAAGNFRAMEANCRHQSANLFTGRIDGNIAVCPRHGWRYDISTGKCLSEGAWANLRSHDLKIQDGVIWVAVKPTENEAEEEIEDW